MERYSGLPTYGSQQKSKEPASLLGYDITIDVADYKKQNEPKSRLMLRKKHDLETMLGERFNVEVSNTNYRLENGKLYHEEFEEPFTERIKLGIEYRKNKNSPDQVREHAELEGFIKLEESIRNAQPGAKFIVISPPGVEYPKKFFDLYEKTTDAKITASRYTSTLTVEGLYTAGKEIDSAWQIQEGEKLPSDADFLKNPIYTTMPKDEILKTFLPEEDTMNISEYHELTEASAPIITAYLNELAHNPNSANVLKNYNALLNFADEYVKNKEARTSLKSRLHYRSTVLINELSAIPVDPVMAGCGRQGGYDTNTGTAPYSVADFAPVLPDQYGTRQIRCENPTCRAVYARNFGQLESCCRICGGTQGIAC